MLLILKRDWEAIDASDLSKRRREMDVIIPSGRHEVERIENPFGHPDAPWLVLKGTKIGATEGSWRQWAPNQTPDLNGSFVDWEEYEVVVED